MTAFSPMFTPRGYMSSWAQLWLVPFTPLYPTLLSTFSVLFEKVRIVAPYPSPKTAVSIMALMIKQEEEEAEEEDGEENKLPHSPITSVMLGTMPIPIDYM